MNKEVNDLRSALAFLAAHDGQLVETDVEVDPINELAGVYRHVGAGGTVERPTKLGPAMVFNNLKGFPGARCAIGTLCSRERVGLLLGADPRQLGFVLNDAVNHPIDPVVVPSETAPCHQVVYRAMIPASTSGRSCRPAPTPPTMPAPTSPWACATPPTPTRGCTT